MILRHLKLCFCFSLLISISVSGKVKLPAIFGNNMIIQRNKPVSIWGKANPSEKITLTFGKVVLKTKANPDSSWKLTIPMQQAGGPHIIQVKASNEITFKDVYFGEVWIASGQSNMEYKMSLTEQEEIAKANFPLIRYIDVKNRPAASPKADFETEGWKATTSKSVLEFSAVAFYFAREINQKLNVPVGVILSEWGGTPAETWTSKEGLAAFPEFNNQLADLEVAEKGLPNNPAVKIRLQEFSKSLFEKDKGTIGQWWKKELLATETDWKTIQNPNLWKNTDLEQFDGAVWFRKEFNVGQSLANEKDAILRLSKIDDLDSTWINGVKIGGMRGYDRNRNYGIPAGVLKEGKNVIAIRVIDWSGTGGFWGDKDEFKVHGKTESVSLVGDWMYKTGAPASILNNPGDDLRMQNMATALFNGMINPLVPLSIQGVIWYQGESNAAKAQQYQALFPALIKDWRNRFGQGDFPFLFVQLANFMKPEPEPGQSNWAELREAQTMTLALPNTGMALAIDIGDANDVHPKNKIDVGLRLAKHALEETYKQPFQGKSPMLEKADKQGNAIKISFKNLYDGLMVKDKYGYIKGFAVAGADKKFVWATAQKIGNQILVSSPLISNPEYVRYAWANNPDDVNLYNSADLPMCPFRTDK